MNNVILRGNLFYKNHMIDSN